MVAADFTMSAVRCQIAGLASRSLQIRGQAGRLPKGAVFVSEPFHILSVDGGGFRGLFAAHLLKKMEEAWQIDWGHVNLAYWPEPVQVRF